LEAFYIIGFLMLAIVLISLMLARPSRPITSPPPLPKAGQLNRPILVMLTWRGRDFPTVPAAPPAIEDFNDLTDAPRRA
jgi:hypothetical protein